MKGPTFDLRSFLFRNDAEGSTLWRNYQLSVTPKFYGVLCLLLAIATVRNLLGDATVAPTLLLTLLTGVTTAAGYARKPWFQAMTRVASFGFMLIILWAYLDWAPGYPPPTLILLPLAVLFIVFADHLAMATIFIVFAFGLLVHAALQVPPGAMEQLELVLAFAVTTGLLYLCAVVLWFLLHGLFRARADVSETLETSLSLRQSLLTLFFDNLSPPLVALEQQLKRDTVAWLEVDRLTTEVRKTLRLARHMTLSLGSQLDPDPGHSERELQDLRDHVWRFLALAALATILAIVVAGLLGPPPVRLMELGAALVPCALLWNASRHPGERRARLVAMYGLVAFIALHCALALAGGRAPHGALYFYLPVFCAVFVGGALHAGIIALCAAAVLFTWLFAYPSLEGAPAYMRSNIGLALVFILTFSLIVWTWFRQSLRDLSDQDRRLRLESETRQRLMATLFHDIANPLHVIQTNAELAQDGIVVTDQALLRNLATKIRALVSFTREFDELERSGDALPVEAVELTPVFADLHASFRAALAAKQLELSVPLDAPAVLAHPVVLGASVLANLLSNAVKFSPRGGRIHIGTEVLPTGRVKIRIRDNGGGLSPGILRQVYSGERIQSRPGTAGEPGDGQGLRLTTLYLGRMNGTLTVDADSAVVVELPLAR